MFARLPELEADALSEVGERRRGSPNGPSAPPPMR